MHSTTFEIKNKNNKKRKLDLTQDNYIQKKKIICDSYISSKYTETSKQIVCYIKQIIGHTTVKKAKYIEKCIATLIYQIKKSILKKQGKYLVNILVDFCNLNIKINIFLKIINF